MLDGSVWFSSSSTTPWGSGPGVTSRAPPARLAGGGRRSHQPVDDETRPATRRGRRGGAQQKAPRGTPAMTACSVRVPGRRTAIGAAHHGRGPGNTSRNPPRALSSQKSLAGMRRHHPRAARGGLSPPPGGRHTRFGADAGFAAPADTVPPPPTDHSAAALPSSPPTSPPPLPPPPCPLQPSEPPTPIHTAALYPNARRVDRAEHRRHDDPPRDRRRGRLGAPRVGHRLRQQLEDANRGHDARHARQQRAHARRGRRHKVDGDEEDEDAGGFRQARRQGEGDGRARRAGGKEDGKRNGQAVGGGGGRGGEGTNGGAARGMFMKEREMGNRERPERVGTRRKNREGKDTARGRITWEAAHDPQ